MRQELETFWSDRYGRRLHKLTVAGTSKSILMNDDELRHVAELATRALNEPSR